MSNHAKMLKLLPVAILLISITRVAKAQNEPPLVLSLSRNFGYSSGTGAIQGTFTLRASGPENLERVVFYIDDQVLAEVNQPPFEIRFQTGSYPLGVHTLQAKGYTSDGQELLSNEQRREFVSAETGWQAAVKIIVPIFGVIVLAIAISFVIPSIMGRKKGQVPLGASRSYGALGGAVCPKCRRPFGVHVWGINLLIGKLDRCPHCGRWSIVQRATPTQLRAAEEAELSLAANNVQDAAQADDHLKKDLEDSRYQDL